MIIPSRFFKGKIQEKNSSFRTGIIHQLTIQTLHFLKLINVPKITFRICQAQLIATKIPFHMALEGY